MRHYDLGWAGPFERIAAEMLGDDLVSLASSYEREFRRGSVHGSPKKIGHHRFEWERGWVTEVSGEIDNERLG